MPYACAIAYEVNAAGQTAVRGEMLGLEQPVSFLRTLNCIKAIQRQIQKISQMLVSQPQELTAENNPAVVKKE